MTNNINPKRKQEIRKKANAIRGFFDIKGAADLNKILEYENITLYRSNLDNIIKGKSISGILRIEDNLKEIYINENHIETRNTFTVAHELGHFYLHRGDVLENGGQLISFRGTDINLQEKEADLFSAELLMPKKEIYSVATINKNGDISFLADYFKVSKAAMAKRIQELNEESENEYK